MVINLKIWREIGAKNILVAAAHEISEKLKDPDQDVLNYVFYNRCIHLDYIWNAISPFFKQINQLTLSKTEIQRVASQARIIHFNGSSKPWQYMCMHPYQPVYARCLRATEWRSFVPKDFNNINILKKLIARLLGEKISFYISNFLKKIKST